MTECILMPRWLAKQCLNTLLKAVEKDIHDPVLQWELLETSVQINKLLGCKAEADRIARRTIVEDEPE